MKAIREFEGLRALRLEGNTVGVEAARAIASALEDKRDFQVFTMSHFTLPHSISHRLTMSHTLNGLIVSHTVPHLLTCS